MQAVPDPVTGESGLWTGIATIIGNGVKHLVELTIDTDGDKGSATGSIVATDGHPFWVVNRQAWLDAGDLQIGDQVVTATGATMQVAQVRTWTALQ